VKFSTPGYTENAMIQAGRLPDHVRLLIKPFTKLALARALRQALEADKPRSETAPG
jgi:hypothetical protein